MVIYIEKNISEQFVMIELFDKVCVVSFIVIAILDLYSFLLN